MPRSNETTAEYFPFFVKDGRTLFILQSKYGLEGIGFFTNLFRLLCSTPGHVLDISDPVDHLYMVSKIGVEDEARADKLLDLMAATGKIDKQLWEMRVIYSEDLVRSLGPLYAKRSQKPRTLQEVTAFYLDSGTETSRETRKDGVSGAETTDDDDVEGVSGADSEQSGAEMPQSRVEKRREEIIAAPVEPDPPSSSGLGEFSEDLALFDTLLDQQGSSPGEDAEPSGEKVPKARDPVLDDPLYVLISQSFDAKNLNAKGKVWYTNFAAEAKAKRRLVTNIRARAAPEFEEECAKQIIMTYWNLVNGTDGYWAAMPFTPSRLSSSGIFDSVVKAAVKTEAVEDFSYSPVTPEAIQQDREAKAG